MTSVQLENPESLNLVGLMLGAILKQNLQNESKAGPAALICGNVGIQVGQMKVTLRCENGRFAIVQGLSEDVKARVSGEMRAFLDITLGRGLVIAWLCRKIKVGGNLLLLLKLLPLLRIG